MRRISNVLTLVMINGLLGTWAAMAKPADTVIGFDRSLKLASVSVSSDHSTDGNSAYLFTMTLPERAGKPFTKVSIAFTEQNQDRTIAPMPFDLSDAKAFTGAPKQGGRAIAIQNTWIDETGVLWVQFNAPVPPRTHLTLALKLRQLPAAARYNYAIAAYPANTAAIFVGDGTLTIKQ